MDGLRAHNQGRSRRGAVAAVAFAGKQLLEIDTLDRARPACCRQQPARRMKRSGGHADRPRHRLRRTRRNVWPRSIALSTAECWMCAGDGGDMMGWIARTHAALKIAPKTYLRPWAAALSGVPDRRGPRGAPVRAAPKRSLDEPAKSSPMPPGRPAYPATASRGVGTAGAIRGLADKSSPPRCEQWDHGTGPWATPTWLQL